MGPQTSVQDHAKGPSQVKEVQMLLKSWLDDTDGEVDSSSGNWPGFVWLLELHPGEVIYCTHASLKA